ncbi:DUF2339 domain-containing protein [Fusibacter sp. JL216-2]|uniref:DUF2339 domain-containing protein n=1 Tax=Fusibacter sp. JL216-2 TaxID=3071453 RepID=UPI003D3321E2
MYWFIGLAIIIFLLVRVISLTDQIRKHERWIKKLNKDIKTLASELADVKDRGIQGHEATEADADEGSRSQEEISPVQAVDEVSEEIPIVSKKKVTITPSVHRKKTSKDRFSFDLTSLTIESIISKIGIGLVLVGLGFLFNYAYDRGLITEQLTIILGYMLGLGLYGSGFYTLKKDRQKLGHVLIGGSISAFYITTYAGYLFYDLIGQPLAFAVLCTITLWAFLSSVYLKAQSISIVAVVGGLLVPFMTDLDFIGLSGLGIYIGIVALGTMIIYFFHRWRYLQIAGIVSVYFALFLMGTGYNMVGPDTGLFFGLLVYLVIVHTLPDILGCYLERHEGSPNTRENLINVVAPLVTVVYAVYFDLASQNWMALVFAGLALLYAGVFIAYIRKQLQGHMNVIVAGTSGIYLAFSSILYFDGGIRPLMILIISLVFYYGKNKLAGRKGRQDYLTYIGHGIMGLGLVFVAIDLALAFDTGGNTGTYIGHTLSIIVMGIGAWLQKGNEEDRKEDKKNSKNSNKKKNGARKGIGVLAMQVYASVLLLLMVYENVLEDVFLRTLLVVYFIWVLVLQAIKEKLNIIPDTGLMIFAFILPLIRGLTAFVAVVNFEFDGLALTAGMFLSIGLYALAELRYKDEINRSGLKVAALSTLTLSLVPDLYVLTETLTYGVTIIGLILILYGKYDKDNFPVANVLKSSAASIWTGLFVLSNGLVLFENGFSALILLSTLVQLLILFLLLSDYIKDRTISFVSYSVLFFFASYSALSGLNGADGAITLTWAAYALLRLTYHMMKGQKKLTYYALGLIVFVVGKYILVDISTVSVLWKVVTSMIFGFALLILSYLIQPMIDKFSNGKESQGE